MRFNSDLIGDGNELVAFRFQEGSSLPTDPFLGQLFHLHVPGTISKVFYYDGTQWICGVTSLNGRQGDLTLGSADVGLENVDNTRDIDKPVSTAQAAADIISRDRATHTGTQTSDTISDFTQATDQRILERSGQPNGIASLNESGKVPEEQLPEHHVTETYIVNSLASQLALTTFEGDYVVRTDIPATYVRNAGITGTINDWSLLAEPEDLVISVNGMKGIVVVTKATVGLGNVDNTPDVNKPVSIAQAAADTASRTRSTHTGTQLASTISDFATAADIRIGVQKGNPNGLASLGLNGQVPPGQLPFIPVPPSLSTADPAFESFGIESDPGSSLAVSRADHVHALQIPGYVHYQTDTQTVWTITHNLGFDPAGVVVTSADGYMLDGYVVQYLNTGISLRVSFDLGFSGTAVLS